MVYCWSYDLPQKMIKHETNITTNHTMVAEGECERWLEENPDEIGGLVVNGNPITS